MIAVIKQRISLIIQILFSAAIGLVLLASVSVAAAAKPARPNLIQIENAKPGTDLWHLTDPATHREVEGYASATSVNRGESLDFFVNTNDRYVQVEVFRMGWYGGLGARKMPVPVKAFRGKSQKMPVQDPDTGLMECDWNKSFSLGIPDKDSQEWVSGHYLVKLTGSSGKQSYMHFVVRDDRRQADIAVNASVTTWEAYNNWPGDTQGGKSVYEHNSSDEIRAHKVSFNRPYAVAPNPLGAVGVGAGEFLTNVQPSYETHTAGWEYAFSRFIEQSGQDVKYVTDVDLHDKPEILNNVKLVFSVGHDEYYSHEMRGRLETFHAHGGHVGVLSSNTMYWQIRMESSTSGNRPSRTMVVYKDPVADPVKGERTSHQWRSDEVNNPEQSFFGLQYEQDPADPLKKNDGVVLAIDNHHWLMKGTGLSKGHILRGAIGYEADRIQGATPPGVELLGQADYYNHRDEITGVQHMTLRHGESGGKILSVGGMNFVNLLDDYNQSLHGSKVDPVARQIILNFVGALKMDDKELLAVARKAGVIPGSGPARDAFSCHDLFTGSGGI